MDPRPDSPIYDSIADTVASVLPKAIEYGIPGASEIDVTSITPHVRAEINAVGYAMLTSPVVCVWSVKQL